MIILEGPEGAGKSTLGMKLSSRLRMPLIHTGGPVQSKEELHDRLDDLNIMRNPRKIFDRIPLISELMYAPLQNRQPFITRKAAIDVLTGINPTIYYCRLADQERMFKQMIEGKTHKSAEWMETIRKNHVDLVASYDELMDELRRADLRVILYDWTDPSCAV